MTFRFKSNLNFGRREVKEGVGQNEAALVWAERGGQCTVFGDKKLL